MPIFPERAVPESGNPITPEHLRLGGHYFRVSFVDSDMCVPEMIPLVFIGRGQASQSAKKFVFQDFYSYSKGVEPESERHSTDNSESRLEVYGRKELGGIYEFEDALNSILRCSLRRGKRNAM